MAGSLVIVGTGIQLGQVTLEAKAYIEQAETVLYLVADPVTENWIMSLNTGAESLFSCYRAGGDRLPAYEDMVERIMSPVRAGKQVCTVFYGHPGVFVYPSHKAIHLAQQEGYSAKMLPGVSAEDCLFADLGFDPVKGCQTFEASHFLTRKIPVNTSVPLILWQIGVVGDITHNVHNEYRGLPILVEYLLQFYHATHDVVVYEAAQYAVCKPVIERVSLEQLTGARVTPISTLYVPASTEHPVDQSMQEKLRQIMKSK